MKNNIIKCITFLQINILKWITYDNKNSKLFIKEFLNKKNNDNDLIKKGEFQNDVKMLINTIHTHKNINKIFYKKIKIYFISYDLFVLY